MNYKGLIVTITSLMLIACGSESEDATFLEGTWKPDYCYDSSEDGQYYANTTFTFSGSRLYTLNTTYSSSGCEDQFKISEFRTTNTFKILENVALGTGENVTKLEISVSSADFVALNADGVARANTRETCDRSDWVAGESQSVLDCFFPTANDRITKQIAYIDDNNELFLGLVPEGEDYPTELDYYEPHIKK